MEFNELTFREKRNFIKTMRNYPNTDIRNVISDGIYTYDEILKINEDLINEMVSEDMLELNRLASKSRSITYADEIINSIDTEAIVGSILYSYDINTEYLYICDNKYVYRDSIKN